MRWPKPPNKKPGNPTPHRRLIDDPVAVGTFRGLWQGTAARNTAAYEEAFRCTPSDKVRFKP